MKRVTTRSDTPPLLLRIRDAAAMLSVSERSIWHLIRSGELRAIHPEGMRAIRIARRDVENLVERWHNHEDRIADQHP
jgi:excisionase family DNA binding protein